MEYSRLKNSYLTNIGVSSLKLENYDSYPIRAIAQFE